MMERVRIRLIFDKITTNFGIVIAGFPTSQPNHRLQYEIFVRQATYPMCVYVKRKQTIYFVIEISHVYIVIIY